MTVLVKGCSLDSSIQDRPFPVQTKPVEPLVKLLTQWRRNDNLRRRVAHHVGFGPPEQLGGLRVPVGDESPTVHEQDRVQYRIDDHAPFILVRTQGAKRVFSTR